MTGEELYKQYKGRQASIGDAVGIVCGYDPCTTIAESAGLIIAVTEGQLGWEPVHPACIVTHQNNPLGYLWVSVYRISPLKPSLWSRITKRFLGR